MGQGNPSTFLEDKMTIAETNIPQKLLSFILVCLVIPTLTLQGQSITSTTAFDVSMESLFDFIEENDPGCSLGIIEQNRLSYMKNRGSANLDWSVPVSSGTIFDIASLSKQFTATAIALLEIDGALQIDDDVRKWIPELKVYTKPITIRHLLNHTSGIRDYLALMNLASIDFNNVFTEFDAVEIILQQDALNFTPGDQFMYSNSGYLLAAHIVRRVTGQSLRTFLEQRVFGPLNMHRTQIWDNNREIVKERATGYSLSSDQWGIDHLLNFQMGGDGQVLTSIEELAKWDNNFYDATVGGSQLLSKLHTRGILNNGDTIDYALGLTVDNYRGLKRVMHTGSWGGFRTNITRYPNQQTTFILLCNRSDGTEQLDVTDIADLVLIDHFTEASTGNLNLRSDGSVVNSTVDDDLQSSFNPETSPLNSSQNYTGEYWSVELGVSFFISSTGQELSLQRPDGTLTKMSYNGGSQYIGNGLVLDFPEANRMILGTSRVAGIKFLKRLP